MLLILVFSDLGMLNLLDLHRQATYSCRCLAAPCVDRQLSLAHCAPAPWTGRAQLLHGQALGLAPAGIRHSTPLDMSWLDSGEEAGSQFFFASGAGLGLRLKGTTKSVMSCVCDL